MTNQVKQLIHAMLIENTGRAICDSGGGIISTTYNLRELCEQINAIRAALLPPPLADSVKLEPEQLELF